MTQRGARLPGLYVRKDGKDINVSYLLYKYRHVESRNKIVDINQCRLLHPEEDGTFHSQYGIDFSIRKKSIKLGLFIRRGSGTAIKMSPHMYKGIIKSPKGHRFGYLMKLPRNFLDRKWTIGEIKYNFVLPAIKERQKNRRWKFIPNHRYYIQPLTRQKFYIVTVAIGELKDKGLYQAYNRKWVWKMRGNPIVKYVLRFKESELRG